MSLMPNVMTRAVYGDDTQSIIVGSLETTRLNSREAGCIADLLMYVYHKDGYSKMKSIAETYLCDT